MFRDEGGQILSFFKTTCTQDEKLLDHDMTNGDSIQLVHGTSKITLIYHGQMAEDVETLQLREELSPAWL